MYCRWCYPDADIAGIRVVDVVAVGVPEFRADRSGITLLTLRALRTGGTGGNRELERYPVLILG